LESEFGRVLSENSVRSKISLVSQNRRAAVAGKARHLPRCNRADLAKTDFDDHPIKAGACNAAGVTARLSWPVRENQGCVLLKEK
jgi:hypothetical protein